MTYSQNNNQADQEKNSEIDINNPKREITGIWIPIEIWEHKELVPLEKILYAEICSLGGEKNGCYASNEYFAKHLQVTERRIQQMIQHLKDLKLIYISKFNGRIRWLKSFRGRGEMDFRSP